MRTRGIATAALILASALTAAAADQKTYQVTGPVVDVTPESITVQKNKENWTIARGADTKVTGDVKKGEKVTVVYSMTATSIEAKATPKPAAAKPADAKTADAGGKAAKPAGEKAAKPAEKAAEPAAKPAKPAATKPAAGAAPPATH